MEGKERKEQWKIKRNEITMGGSKGANEQWEDQKGRKNNGRIKRYERTMEEKERNNNEKIKGTKEQWEDQRDEKNNRRSKRTLTLKFS